MLKGNKVFKITIAFIAVVGIIAAGIVIYNHSGKKEEPKDTEKKETNNVVVDDSDDSDASDDENDKSTNEGIFEKTFDGKSYFITQSDEFYKLIINNPIDEKYVVDYSSTTMEVKEALIKKCEAWNKQSDYTVSKLEGVLEETEYEAVKNLVKLWREYYEEELGLNSAMYGLGGIIPGSMYTGLSMQVLETKCRFTAYILLSYEYELTGNVSFVEGETSINKTDGYEFSPESFCIEDVEEFENIVKQYSLDEKDVVELKELIISTAGEINPIYKEHTKKYVIFIEGLYPIELMLLNKEESCLSLEKNRLKLFAMEILNIEYMISQAKMIGE